MSGAGRATIRRPARDFGSTRMRPPVRSGHLLARVWPQLPSQPCRITCRCRARRTVSVPLSRSIASQQRPSASPCRRPRASPTDQRAPLGCRAATLMSFLASARVRGSTSLSTSRGGRARTTGLRDDSVAGDRFVEGGAQHAVQRVDGAGRQTPSLQSAVERFHVLWLKSVEAMCANPRDRVLVDVGAVTVECSASHALRGDVVQPVFEPLAHCRLAFRWERSGRSRGLAQGLRTFVRAWRSVAAVTCRRSGRPSSRMPMETRPCQRPSAPRYTLDAWLGARPASLRGRAMLGVFRFLFVRVGLSVQPS